MRLTESLQKRYPKHSSIRTGSHVRVPIYLCIQREDVIKRWKLLLRYTYNYNSGGITSVYIFQSSLYQERSRDEVRTPNRQVPRQTRLFAPEPWKMLQASPLQQVFSTWVISLLSLRPDFCQTSGNFQHLKCMRIHSWEETLAQRTGRWERPGCREKGCVLSLPAFSLSCWVSTSTALVLPETATPSSRRQCFFHTEENPLKILSDCRFWGGRGRARNFCNSGDFWDHSLSHEALKQQFSKF